MRAYRSVCVGAALAALTVASTMAVAQEAAPPSDLETEIVQFRRDIEAMTRQYEARIADLEARVAALQARQLEQAPQTPAGAPPTPSVAGDAGSVAGTLPLYGAAAAGTKIFNPDLAIVGDFAGTAGRNPVVTSPAFEMREAEAAFQAIVDPYARGDFFVGFGSFGADLEEAYVTLSSLPGGLLARAGKMRTAFGKVNGLHGHQLSWTDRPLVTSNLVGGDEGIGDAGVSVARLLPVPGLFLEVTGQVFRGNSGDIFHASRASDVSYTGHLRAYRDLSESSNAEVGVSYAAGHNGAGVIGDADVGRFGTELYGLDATMRWKPLRRAIYRSFIGRAEVVWSQRDQFGGLQRAHGYYVSADYQLARRWFAGARYDRAGHAEDASAIDRGQSLALTFWPSEFSQLRGQYRRTAYAAGAVAYELLMQLQFSIGVHGAHPF